MTPPELVALPEHHRFCSAAGSPCPIKCWTWPASAAECFPNLDPETVALLDAQLADEIKP